MLILNNFEKNILFEDNHLLIVNKWPGLLSQSDKTGDASLIDLAKAYIKKKYNKSGEVYLGIPHRLDRPVSGAIICCRTSKALERMNALIKKREIEKKYHVLSSFQPMEMEGKLISYLKKDSRNNTVVSSQNEKAGYKKAILSYKYLKRTSLSYHLLEVILETGRSHQIRVQLRDMGCPILGDMKYFKQAPLEDKSIGLHAYSLKFVHPVRKTELFLTAPYPAKAWWKIN